MHCFYVGAVDDRARAVLSTLAQEFEIPSKMLPDLASLRSDQQFATGSFALVIVAVGTSEFPMVAEVVGFAREHSGAAFTVCLADGIAPDDYKRLVRTGAAEWIAWRSWQEELRELVARLEAPVALTRSAKVVSVLPSKGGVGTTTLVSEMAVHLARRQRRPNARIAILDLNFQGGTLADGLDLEPRLDVLEIVDRPERLDEHLVDIFTSRRSKGLDVFTSPDRRIVPDAIKPEIVFTVVDAVASRYDIVLFDLPSQPMAWTDNLLRGSDAVIACGGENVPSLRRLTALLGHLDGLGLTADKVATVVNGVSTDFLGRVARRALIERALGGRRIFFIRRDDGRIGHALDVGRPLLEEAPSSRIGRDLTGLAGWLQPMVSSPQPVPVKAVRSRSVPA